MKKNVLRLLALVMVLVLMVPLFAACGKKKEPEVTTPAVTTPAPTPEGPAGPTGPTADSFKGAINDLVTLLTQNGAGANSTIAAQLKGGSAAC